MTSSSPQDRARQLVDELAANNACFTHKPADGSLPPSFTYEVGAGGDRQRCRRLVAAAKTDPILWHDLVAEIGRRCNGGAR